MGSLGSEASGSIAPVINANYAELRKRGFYFAASWHWDGEWYGGVDRVPYLEAALAASTGEQPPPVIGRRAPLPPERIAAKEDVLDFWISYRSPYSYLALERAASLPARFPIQLRVRPVLPLAMRGAAPTRDKQVYIVRDAKREADRLGIPFGAICDPLGKGVEHALAITYALSEAERASDRGTRGAAGGKALDFVRSAMRGSWAEARDLASYVDLRAIVERAGIDWADAKAAMAGSAWREWAKAAADDLAVAGLWGVPSFRIGDYATWGQDRIELLEDRLRRHFAASAPAATSDSA
jgi:2-hydroxychromene-2-carboxylate isomerase